MSRRVFLRLLLGFSLGLVSSLAASPPAAAQVPATRPARPDEIRALCAALRQLEEAEHRDQAVDLESCLRGPMTARRRDDGWLVSGPFLVNFPGHTMRETCQGVIRAGRVDPATIDCR